MSIVKLLRSFHEKSKVKKVGNYLLNIFDEYLNGISSRYGIAIIDKKFGLVLMKIEKLPEYAKTAIKSLVMSFIKSFREVEMEGNLRIGVFNISIDSKKHFIVLLATDIEEEEKLLSAKLNISSVLEVINEYDIIDDVLKYLEESISEVTSSEGEGSKREVFKVETT